MRRCANGATPPLLKPSRLITRAILIEPEEARLRVAALGQRRDGARFDKAEAQGQHRIDDARILVEPGGETDRIAELQPHDGGGEDGIVGFGAVSGETVFQSAQGRVVGAFRGERVESGECEAVHHGHRSHRPKRRRMEFNSTRNIRAKPEIGLGAASSAAAG